MNTLTAGGATTSYSPSSDGRIAHDYAVFGGVLRSELELPELVCVSGGAPRWTLRIARGNPRPAPAVLLGERSIGAERYRLLRTPAELRMEYSHAGTFTLSTDGSVITWHPGADNQRELARSIVTGPMLALALESEGCLCLHGSAVAVGNVGVAFIAPKYHGKSTLAVALTAAGAAFIGDDTLAVDHVGVPCLRPGTGSARLWSDSARHLQVDALCEIVLAGVKTTAGFGARLCRTSVPLAAVYLLDPVSPGTGALVASRAPLPPAAGAVALSHHAKLPDSLVGLAAAGRRLSAAASLASKVPLYRLTIPRGFEALPEVVEQIMAWHSAAPTATIGA